MPYKQERTICTTMQYIKVPQKSDKPWWKRHMQQQFISNNCINHQLLPEKQALQVSIFCSTPTQRHTLSIKTLTLLTTIDCLEVIRSFNIMSIKNTFGPFKWKSKTKFEKRPLESKSFSLSICSPCVCVPTTFKILTHPTLFGSCCTT